MSDLTKVTDYCNITDIYPEEPAYPVVLEDGNTVGWYLSDDLTTITKDGSDFVSEWRDYLGSGRDLAQTIGDGQPKWVLDDGILFDGISNNIRASFTLIQPAFIYIVFKQVSWTNSDRIFDGINNGFPMTFSQFGTEPDLWMYAADNGFDVLNSISVGNYMIARNLYNGSSSKCTINTNTPTLGTVGTLKSIDGFVLGSNEDAGECSNIQVKEVILRKIADAAQDEQDIYDYLANKYSIL